jgi:hypothetical protein
MVTARPLWTCPRCGRKFVTRNMWHSCSPHTVERFLAGKGPRARAMFNRFIGHYLRISSPGELDEQVRGWLRESYQIGLQRHLGGRANDEHRSRGRNQPAR